MEFNQLSQSEKSRGRRLLLIFQAVNAFSFIILTGNLITLYIIRLGGTGFYVGLISSIQYVAFFFMFIGKGLVKKTGIRKLMGACWFLRNIFLIPMLLSPLLVNAGRTEAGLLLVFLCSFAYHVVRGVGIVSFNPMVGAVADNKTRGDFLSRLQIVNHALAIVAGISTALLLGKDAPLSRYVIFILCGIAAGLISGLIAFKLPETPSESEKGTGEKLADNLRVAFKRKSFIRFSLTFFFLSLVHGMVAPFLILYAREIYSQTDQFILIFSVAGGFGAIVIGFLTRLLMDRIGAKPLYILFSFFFSITLIPLIVSLPLTGTALFVYFNVLFFINQLGIAGGQITAQNYFFGIITQKEHFNLGIYYNLISGIAGIIGSLSGGLLLDIFTRTILPGGAYRLFFSIPLIILFLILFLMLRLEEAGSYSIRDTLNIIFSPRDLRAVSLLKKLDRSNLVSEEVQVIQEIGDSQSSVPVDDLLQKLKSPRFEVRNNALRALERLPLTETVIKALISEVKNHHFTTAYTAARILGDKKVAKARNILRKALHSEDYLLQAKAAVALAQMGDRESIPIMEDLLKASSNPLLIIHCSYSLDLLKSYHSIPVLLETLKGKDPPPFLRDEVILSISGILGMEKWFYPFYTDYLAKSRETVSNLMLLIREKATLGGWDPKPPERMLLLLHKDRNRFGKAVRSLFRSLSSGDDSAAEILSPFISAAEDKEFLRFERLCFLLACIVVFFYIGKPN